MAILPYNGVWPKIAEDAFVAPNATIIGNVTIGAGASIWFGAVLRADMATITIGERTNIQDNCVLHVDTGQPCTVEADSSVGHGAVVHGAHVGAGCLVGMRATLLNGSEVGPGSVVAANSLVPENTRYEPGQLLLGTPARALRPINDEERARIQRGVDHYQRFAGEYAAMLRRHGE